MRASARAPARPADPAARPRVDLPGLALPLRAGLGLRPQHVDEWARLEPDVGFLEIHAENYLVDGGPMHHHLTRLRARYPLAVHGVGLSLGGAAPPDEAHLDRLARLLDRYQPAVFSEHLAWSGHGGHYLADLLPLPWDQATLDRVCDHIDRVQARLRRTLLLENPASYLEFAHATLDEAGFLREVTRRTGCGLLLDLANAQVSAVNLGRDAWQFIQQLPLDRIGQLHLAGYARDPAVAGPPLLIDDHGAAVQAEVWQLHAALVARCGPLPTLIERDNDLPPLPVLLAEAAQAEATLVAARRAPARPAAGRAAAVRARPGKEGAGAVAGATEAGWQSVWSAALLDPSQPPPPGLRAGAGAVVAQRLAVHRNNVVAGLVRALAQTFPVMQRLVGAAFFDAMAAVFVRQSPPGSPVLADYGGGFAPFVGGFSPARSVPCLAEMARLEWARAQAWQAADARPLDDRSAAAALARAVPGDASVRLPGTALAELRLQCHPSLRVLRADHAVVSLWAAHQGPDDGRIAAVELGQAECALVLRPWHEVLVVPVSPAVAALADALGQGQGLAGAAGSALAIDAHFDLTQALRLLLTHGALTGLHLP